MTALKWIGTRPQAVCAAFKKELPTMQPWQTACRIQFRFETVWCIMDKSKAESLLLKDGSTVAVATVHNQFGSLIGLADPYQTGLDYNEQALSFRNALDERNMESAKP